jgi:alpha-beta hydrolase superfamily lysophospholipase
MSRLSCACFLLAAAGIVLANGLVHAQESAENVNILTPDGVKLRGQFYPSEKKCLATVIMLHPVGEGKSMKVPEWKNLALTLQKAGYSVLMFDFRGHGDSTEIASPKDFWNIKANVLNVKTKNKDEIDVKDYIKQGSAYLPVLVNDIAAARAYLDRRNDNNKDCNTSSIIVIGADTGATLGAIWMNAEGFRYKYTPAAAPLMKAEWAKTSEGNDIIAAVFLSISPKLENRKVSVSAILKNACKDKGTAVCFLSGKDDAKFAKTMETNLKVAKSNKHQFIVSAEAPTDLSGVKLLTASLKTDGAILKYLDGVVDDRKSEWAEHDFEKSLYFWRSLSGQPSPAKKKGEKTLVFDDYNKFIPQ